MRRIAIVLVALTLACTAAQQSSTIPSVPQPPTAMTSQSTTPPPSPAPAPSAAATPPPAQPAPAANPEEEKWLAELRESIKGKETLPANQVFKNIKQLNALSAERLLRVMQFGYSRSLGVTCTHCHTPGLWEDDSKMAKRITRQMAEMVTTLNRDVLPKIEDLESRKAVVNCTTCHRGKLKPATQL